MGRTVSGGGHNCTAPAKAESLTSACARIQWAHIAVGELLSGGGRSWLGGGERGRGNILGNVAVATWVAALQPFSALPAALEPFVSSPKSASAAACAAVAFAGFLFSAAVAVALTMARHSTAGGVALACAAWTVALSSLFSDVVAPWRKDGAAFGGGRRRIHCGNFGLLVAQHWAAVTDALAIMEARRSNRNSPAINLEA